MLGALVHVIGLMAETTGDVSAIGKGLVYGLAAALPPGRL